MPHSRCTWTCMRHYQSKPRCISGKFIRQKAPSNLKKKKKCMRAGCSFLFQSQDTKVLLILKSLNPPNLIFSSHSTSTSMSTTVTRAYWVISERGHKRKVSSCPATYPEYGTVRELTAPKASRAEGSSMCPRNHKITSHHDLRQKQSWDGRAGSEIR